MSDMLANHISMRVHAKEAFLNDPYGMMYEEITASCLIKVDLAGNVLSRPDAQFVQKEYEKWKVIVRESQASAE